MNTIFLQRANKHFAFETSETYGKHLKNISKILKILIANIYNIHMKHLQHAKNKDATFEDNDCNMLKKQIKAYIRTSYNETCKQQ
jgi:hypothetical protein